MNIRTHSFAALFAIIGAATAQEPAGDGREAAEVVAPTALQKARRRAAVHNKRVLVALPAPGQDLAALVLRDSAVSRTFRYEFEVVTGGAERYASLPRPALVIEDAAGKQLATFASDTFLADGKLRGARLLAAAKPHFCAPVDAQEKLQAAMATAKKTGKNILIRFDAPW